MLLLIVVIAFFRGPLCRRLSTPFMDLDEARRWEGKLSRYVGVRRW
jgi:hypothetical protein